MREHGIGAIYENGFITICKGEWKMRIVKAVNVPLTYGGRASFMIQNVLPAVLTAYFNGFELDDIKAALESFIPSPAQTPGRLNMFDFKHFSILLDYAHNPAGLQALKKFIDKIDAYPKVGIIAGIGDRRQEDNEGIGKVAAEMFDEIIVRQDKHLRGKTDQEIIEMLTAGIKQHDISKPFKVIPKESEAIKYAIENVKEGSLIVVCSDVVPDALELVQRYLEEEAKSLYKFKKKIFQIHNNAKHYID